MNQTLQLTDYIPQYVSLYYVDYRDDLDEHEDIQEECIRSNNMEKLYEKAYEWYEEQESSNMHDYLEVEKPRDFDPFGQTGMSPLATI